MGWLVWLWVAVGWAAELRVAVAPFESAAGPELAGLGVGLQSMITTDLAQAEAVTVVERARLQDLLAELELGASGVLDPATAQQLGRVAGATHVVAGSATVVGQTMRLDARLVEVGTGTVALATEAVGEREAFFELEKQLVRALLAGLGAELSPKERAAVGRVHTADFESFARFGQAVSLFDADRYAEAVALLEQVTRGDADFRLAKATLDDVLAVRDQALQRGRAAAIAEAEREHLKHQGQAVADAAQVEALWVQARQSADWQDRVVAAYLLTHGLGGHGSSPGRFRQLRASGDGFALARAAEVAYQLAWAELWPRLPAWFPAQPPYAGTWFDRFPPDEVIARARRRWFEDPRQKSVLSQCEPVLKASSDMGWLVGRRELLALWVPEARRLDLQRELLDAAADCAPPDKLATARLGLAREYIRANRVDAATALLDRLASESTDPNLLRRVAEEARRLADWQAQLEALPEGEAREAWTHWRAGFASRPTPAELSDPARVRFRLHHAVRGQLPPSGPLFVGGVPAWSLVRKGVELSTGPRSGWDQTESIRHYREPKTPGARGEGPTLFVLGGVPRGDGVIRATVDFRPAPDWHPLGQGVVPDGWRPVDARPTAGLLVGLTHLETSPTCDPADPSRRVPVLAQGWGALIRDGALILARLEEVEVEPEGCGANPRLPKAFEVVEQLASRPMRRDHAAIELRVVGSRLEASAGGATVKAELPAPPVGFVGWLADGPGYVELRAPSLD